MSASVSGMRGGQPSTTQPIAAPWLSPKVVTRKRWPKVLNDMAFYRPSCGSPRVGRGQMAGIGTCSSAVSRDAAAREHVNHALVDGVMHGVVPRHDPEVGNQRPGGAAVGGNDRFLGERLVPRAHPGGELRIAFAARWQEAPLVGFAPGDHVAVA